MMSLDSASRAGFVCRFLFMGDGVFFDCMTMGFEGKRAKFILKPVSYMSTEYI